MPVSKIIGENQLPEGSPLLLDTHRSTSSRGMGAIELVLNASYLLWIELVLKDWLLSYHERNYPYAASFAMSAGIIVGFVALRCVHHPRLWRDVILAGATILTAATVAELLPYELGVLPTVAVLTCGLAGPSFLMGKDNITRRRRYFYGAAAVIGLIALIYQPTHGPEKIFWGVIVALVTLSSGAVAVFIHRRGDKAGWRQKMISFRLVQAVSVSLVGGIVLLYLIIMVPVLSISIGKTALLGLGMGWTYQAILESGDIIGIISKQFHMVPAIPLMIGSLAILPLLIRKSGISEWRLALYAAAAIIGLTVVASVNLPGWSVGSNLLSIAKSAGMAWPESTWFALTLVKEQGLLVILIVGCILITCVSASVLVLTRLTEGHDQEARISLCAGAISSFYGMLLGVHLGPPFLTGGSVVGTWALAIVVASVGIGAFSRLQGPVRSRQPASSDTGVKKRRRRLGVLGGIGVGALVTVVCVVSCRYILDKSIQPFAGTATPPAIRPIFPCLPYRVRCRTQPSPLKILNFIVIAALIGGASITRYVQI